MTVVFAQIVLKPLNSKQEFCISMEFGWLKKIFDLNAEGVLEILSSQTETERMSGDTQPQSAEEFDRLVLQSPDSSLVWMRYMAFHLETTEIEKARGVAERALKTISFRLVCNFHIRFSC